MFSFLKCQKNLKKSIDIDGDGPRNEYITQQAYYVYGARHNHHPMTDRKIQRQKPKDDDDH